MVLTRNQQLILATLAEHADAGGKAVGNPEIDAEMNRRHNRHMGYDQLHSSLVRLHRKGWVSRDKHRPARWAITAAGRAALAA